MRLQERFPQRHVCGRGFGAPDRDLQRVNRLAQAARPQINPTEKQMGLRLVRRQKERAAQFVDRLAVALLLEQPAYPFEMERRLFPLLALFAGHEKRIESGRARPFKVPAQALQPAGHYLVGRGGTLLPLRVT